MATGTQTQTLQEASHELSHVSETGQMGLQDEPIATDNTAAKPTDKGQYLKFISVGFSFLVAGVNDGSIGALLPYFIRDYHISTAIVSSLYGANFFGWLAAAFANTHLSQFLDLGAMLALGAVCQIAAHALRAWEPPFGLFVVSFWVVSIGQAFQDTHGNTWVAAQKGAAHRWLAFIHAMYMAGCLIGPFVSTAVASSGEVSRWYLFYVFPLGLGVMNVALVGIAFRDTLRLKPKTSVSEPDAAPNVDGEADVSRNRGALNLITSTLKIPSVWLVSLFFFCYLGAVLTASGWVVEYLVDVRHGDLSSMGYVPAGFNGGALLGRLLLAEPTHRLGERKMIFVYILLSIGLQLVFWLVPNIIAASIAVSFIGFFTGPLFATGIGLGSKLFPPELHSTALAFVFVFAQMGGSLFPIVTGVVASQAGVKVLQPILIGILVATGISWLLIPRPKTVANAALHQE